MKLEKLMNVTLLSTFFCLWFTIYFEEQIEQAIAFILVLSFGILHGANDFKLISKSLIKSEKSILSRVLLFLYVGVVIIGALLFYFLPLFALAIFILFSGYHFGEQHWEHQLKTKSVVKNLLYSSYGLLILGLLFYTNAEEVLAIIADLTGILMPSNYLTIGLISCIVFFIFNIIYVLKFTDNTIHIIKELFYLVVFFIVFKLASLIWAFSIYFILWHSIPSLFEQVHFLYGDFNRKSVWNYIKASFIYWLISIVALFSLFYFLKDAQLLFLSIFFSFLAAITFPHVWVMYQLHKEKDKK